MTEDELTEMAAEIERELDAADGFLYQTVEQRRAYLLAALQRVQRVELPWTTAWPTAKGWYWFYGVTSRWTQAPELLPVCVRHGAHQQPFYVVCGTFIYQTEGARGQWQPMSLPALPGVEEVPRDGV